mmetsp:Transcript_72520/g.132517  ORF Transcript_72520/g.132517 Transcript_72520/m.132517 type:complete len:1279 (+) Transcript_72520:130-3966(+)
MASAETAYNAMVGLNNYCTRNGTRAEWTQVSPQLMVLSLKKPDGSKAEVQGEGPNAKEAKKAAASEFLRLYDAAALAHPIKKARTASTAAEPTAATAAPALAALVAKVSSTAAASPGVVNPQAFRNGLPPAGQKHTHPKSVLSGLCMKAKLQPQWKVDTNGQHPAQCKKWTVTVTIPGIAEIQGHATSKKEAEIAAATNALAQAEHLLQQKISDNAGAAPAAVDDDSGGMLAVGQEAATMDDLGTSGPASPGKVQTPKSMVAARKEFLQSLKNPADTKQAGAPTGFKAVVSSGLAPGESRPPTEAYGFTMATSRLGLNQYLQRRGLSSDIPTEPGEVKMFKATSEVKLLSGKVLKHFCEASNKKEAMNMVALCMCEDLCKLGEMAPFQTRKQALEEGIKPIPLELAPGLEEGVDALLGELSIMDVSATFPEPTPGQSLLLDFDAEPWATTPDSKEISWSPPEWGRNPWKGGREVGGGWENEMEVAGRLMAELSERDLTPAYQATLARRQELPISYMTEHILNAIESSPVTLISGSTGCGKTTQLPQMLLERAVARGEATKVNVLCTQPRRIAAITVAERVAMERGESLGQSVGYHVRFSQMLPRAYASVCYMTTGMLLRWMTHNGLRGVSHLLIDEVHERDLDSDFLLTIIKNLVQNCQGLSVILMSATIDTAKWSSYFGEGFGNTIEIPGRLFPVDVFYLDDITSIVGRPIQGKPDDEVLVDLMERLVMRLVDQSSQSDRGAILCFLPGWDNITALNGKLKKNWKIMQRIRVHLLHSQVPKDEQQAAFHQAPAPYVKVILSTNIAESSVTISDVVYVVDGCQQKQLVPIEHSGGRTAYRLTNTPASKQNLIQRAGRAGRVQNGVCYRLITRAAYERLAESLTPEMLRMPLHQVTLLLKALNLGDAAAFLAQAPDPPTAQAVMKAVIVLQDLKALDSGERITDLGVKMSKLPLEPRMAFALLGACMVGLAEPMAILGAIAASPPLQVPRWDNGQKVVHRQDSSESSVRLLSDHHDALMSCYKVWSMPQPMATQFCYKNWLDYNVIKKVTEAKDQTLQILRGMGFGDESLSSCQHWVSELGTPAETEEHRKHWALLTFLLSFGLEHFAVRRIGTRKVWIGTTTQSQVPVSPGVPEAPQYDVSIPFFLFAELRENEWSSSCRGVSAAGAPAVIFGAARDLTYDPRNECILVDGWAPVKLPYKSAARMSAMRTALRVILLYVAKSGMFNDENANLITAFRTLLAELCLPRVPEGVASGALMSTSADGAGGAEAGVEDTFLQ